MLHAMTIALRLHRVRNQRLPGIVCGSEMYVAAEVADQPGDPMHPHPRAPARAYQGVAVPPAVRCGTSGCRDTPAAATAVFGKHYGDM